MPERLETADVMSRLSLSARPALADVQLTVGVVAAAAGVAAATQAASAPAAIHFVCLNIPRVMPS